MNLQYMWLLVFGVMMYAVVTDENVAAAFFLCV